MADADRRGDGRAAQRPGPQRSTPWRARTSSTPRCSTTSASGLAVGPDRRLKLVANLPYNVATPIIGNLLVHPEFCPSRIVATIQLELAQRMMAEPDTDDYGALSVLVQALTDCRRSSGPCRPASSGPARRSTRPSSRSSPTPPSARRSATSPGSTRSSAGSSSTAARTSAGVLYSLWRDRWTQARGRRPARRPRPDRPGPRRGDERRGAHRPGRRPPRPARRRPRARGWDGRLPRTSGTG